MSESPYIFEINEQNYEQIVIQGSHQVPILVDFWASWCQPCQVLMPMLAKLADEYQGRFILAKINTEEQQAIATQFGIRSIPTVKLFRNGQPVDEFAGALPEAEVRQFLEKHLPRPSDPYVDQALQLVQAGQVDEALDILQQIQPQDPGNHRILVAMAEAHASKGESQTALGLLEALPPEAADSPEVEALRARLNLESQLADSPERAELEARLEADPGDSEARYQLAMRLVAERVYEPALEHLLTLMQKDPQYEDGAARQGLLKVFDLLGSDPLVATYRRRMFNLLH